MPKASAGGDRRPLRLRRGRTVVENPVAVVADDYLFAAAYLGHHLRAERYEAGRARTVARLGHCDAVAYARDDALVRALHARRERREQPLPLAPKALYLVGLRVRASLELLQLLVQLRPHGRELGLALG